MEKHSVVREGAKRVLGLFPYKVQVMGNRSSPWWRAEMRTGKENLTATMPVYLNALSGKGVT